MSTGQPPSGDKSGGEKQSKTGQLSSANAAEKPDAKRPQALSVDDSWDLRESSSPVASASSKATRESSSSPAAGNPPGRSTLPPASRGKFTVGNLLNATQSAAPTPKRGESASIVHRQQIGALPRKQVPRGSVNSPSQRELTREPSRAPTSPAQAGASGVQIVSQSSQRKATPPQPFAAQPTATAGGTASEPRKTPPQFSAVPPTAERVTPSQPFAAFALEAAPDRTTPSQPFAAFTLEAAPPRPARSQPFMALASPMVSVGEQSPEPEDALPPEPAAPPQTVGPRAELTANDLLAPELHETTPKGIGAVSISSPAAAVQPEVTRSAAKVAAAPIIPIASVPIGERAEPVATSERATASNRSQTAAENSVQSVRVVSVKSQPPPPAPVLDDPDGWEVAGGATTTASSFGQPPPPVVAKQRASAPSDPAGDTAVAKQAGDDPAVHESPAKIALEKARASKGKLKANKASEPKLAAKTSPSSHSKLQRVGSAEMELSGEFFAVSPTDQTAPDSLSYHDHEELFDERARRSLSPEVVARRGRYRIVVVLVILGLALLLGAAIALKLLHHR